MEEVGSCIITSPKLQSAAGGQVSWRTKHENERKLSCGKLMNRYRTRYLCNILLLAFHYGSELLIHDDLFMLPVLLIFVNAF